MLEGEPTLRLCSECFLSFFSVGENLREGFQQNIHQLSRYIFNMLMG